jgi:hypothetical protein
MSEDVAAEFPEHAELRALLSDLDPMPARVPVELATSPRARSQLEQIMSQSTEQNPVDDAATTAPRRPFAGRGKTWLAAAAAVVAIAGGIAISFHDGPQLQDTVAPAPSVLALTAPAGATGPARPGGAGMACIRFQVEQLAQAPIAFAGTVTSITPQLVTLKVDHWYKGGTADVVTVAAPSGQPDGIGSGVSWDQGQRYLVSAHDDKVDGCGYTGPAAPELQQAYDQAFPAS